VVLKKLTLSVEQAVIERARRYSAAQKTSISRLVQQFLARLPGAPGRRYSATVQRLLGVLPAKADVTEYHRHLRHKHRR